MKKISILAALALGAALIFSGCDTDAVTEAISELTDSTTDDTTTDDDTTTSDEAADETADEDAAAEEEDSNYYLDFSNAYYGWSDTNTVDYENKTVTIASDNSAAGWYFEEALAVADYNYVIFTIAGIDKSEGWSYCQMYVETENATSDDGKYSSQDWVDANPWSESYPVIIKFEIPDFAKTNGLKQIMIQGSAGTYTIGDVYLATE